MRMSRLLRLSAWGYGLVAATLLVLALASLPGRGSWGLRMRGERVMAVEPGGPAARAGLRADDRIVRLPPAVLGRERTVALTRDGQAVERSLVAVAPGEAERARVALALLLAFAFVAVSTGVLAARSDRLVLAFAAFGFSTAIVLVPSPVAPAWIAEPAGRAWLDLLRTGATLVLPAALVDFFARFPEGRAGSRTRAVVRLGYLGAASLFLLAVLIDLSVRSATPAAATLLLADGAFEALAALFFAGAVGAAVLAFAASYRRAPAHHRPRLTVLVWAVTLGLVPLAALTLLKNVLPSAGWPGERWVPLSLLLVPLGFGYATVVQGVFDLGRFRLRTRRGPVGPARPGPFAPLARVLDEAAGELVAGLGLEHCAVFAVEGGGAVLTALHGQPPPRPTGGTLGAGVVAALERVRGAVALDDLAHPAADAPGAPGAPAVELAPLAEAGTSLLLPLFSEERCRAVLALGPRLSGPWYNAADRERLDAFARQASVAVENAILHDRLFERAALERDVALARRIQQRLLPESAPVLPTAELAGATVPAGDIGGDYYDFLPLAPRAVGLAVADVCGKGLPAALLLAGVQAGLRGRTGEDPAPGAMLARVNEELCALKQPEKFVCLAYARLDARRRTLTWANAGLNPPLVVRADGRVEEVAHGGLILGVEPGQLYEDLEWTFARGDLIAFYTDGVTDSLRDGEPFGPARLAAVLAARRGLRAARLAAVALEESAVWHTGGVADDRTIAIIKFL
jgi:serine phosphatase RsbU (regulator of sigma subunit)